MVQNRYRVLILEDKPEHAKNIEEFITSPTCEPVMVLTPESAYRKLSDGYDCYVFDINVGGTPGHEILLSGIRDGDIRVPCIVMTAISDIKQFEKDYADVFMAFIDKQQSGWVETLQDKIFELAKKDMRQHYMAYQFKKHGELVLKINTNDGWILGDNTITVNQAIELLGSPSITEDIKNLVYRELVNLHRTL